jgi:hypothetical protein
MSAVSGFLPYIEIEIKKQMAMGMVSPYFFAPSSKWKYRGKPLIRYSHKVLGIIWRQACREAGESINLYSGLKHSTASQMINESGYDWATCRSPEIGAHWMRSRNMQKWKYQREKHC